MLTLFIKVWSDKAKDLTLQAAKAAGMGVGNSEIRLIAEPEAAAVHCFQQFKETPDCLKVWVSYFLCGSC